MCVYLYMYIHNKNSYVDMYIHIFIYTFHMYIYLYMYTHMQIPKSEYLLTINPIWFITRYVKTIYKEKRGSKYAKNVNNEHGRTTDDHFCFWIFPYFSNVQCFWFGFGFLEKMLDLHALRPRELLEPRSNVPSLSLATSQEAYMKGYSS